MSLNTRITVRLPAKLEIDFLQRVITDGYGMKGKSKWVYESIKHFMSLEDFEDFVEYASDADDKEKSIDTKMQSLYFDTNFIKSIHDAVIRVRRKYPHLEGVRSLIIRSSIIQRLFRVKSEYVNAG